MGPIATAPVSTNGHLPHEVSSVDHFLRYGAALHLVMERMPWATVAAVGDALVSTWKEGRQVFVFGNGGSSSTAQHMAADFSKNTTRPGDKRLRAICLSDNTALLSALANDNGYAEVFADQMAIYANAGDLAIAISASGNSPNVLAAIERANEKGLLTVGITGYYGGRLVDLAAQSVVVPCHDIEQIEDMHMVLTHMLTSYVRKSIRQELE